MDLVFSTVFWQRQQFRMAFLGSTSMVLALDPQELYFSNDYGSCVTLTAAGPLAGAVAKVQCNSDNTVTLGESCDQDRHFWESGYRYHGYQKVYSSGWLEHHFLIDICGKKQFWGISIFGQTQRASCKMIRLRWQDCSCKFQDVYTPGSQHIHQHVHYPFHQHHQHIWRSPEIYNPLVFPLLKKF